MYFKSLEINGFKSFAEPVVIDFREGITCVVGQKGSGKSNISDALRWVLGEQSPKALRCDRMDEVIFSGTESRRSKGMAEVTLTIDNSDRKLNIDYAEVAITRRMYRSGDTEYLLNNNPCRLRDIRQLIMDTGIGVEGFSIIGQGRIADIVGNKPDSRRQIFEEAAGIVSYKTSRAEAERKLEKSQANLERIDDIAGELEARLPGLEKESAKAKEYLSIKDNYRDLEVNVVLRTIESAEQKKTEFAGDIEDIDQSLREQEEKLTDLDADRVDHRKQRDETEEEISRLNQVLLTSVEGVSSAKRENQMDRQRISVIDSEEKRLQDELSELQEKLRSCGEEETQLKEESGSLREEAEQAKQDYNRKEEEYEKAQAGMAGLSEIVDGGNDRLFELHSEAASRKSEASSMNSYIATLEKRRAEIAEERDRIKAQGEASGEETEKLAERRRQSQEELDELDRGIREDSDREAQLNEKQADSQSRSQELQIAIGGSESRRRTIEEMEQNYEGYNYSVRFILKSDLPGIEGVAAELLDVDKQYALAIETALGAQKQNIVTTDDDSAREAVRLLKEKRAGRQTFLPISSIRGGRADIPKDLERQKGFIGPAVDLIRFDERYRSVFEYLLGRVVVVDRLDTAIRLSKMRGARLRFVTLDGEVINAAGAITGGRHRSEGVSVIGRKSELAELTETIRRRKKELERIGNEEKQREEELSQIEKRISDRRDRRYHLEVELSSMDRELRLREDEAGRISSRTGELEEEQQKIEETIRSSREAADGLAEESRNKEQEIASVTQEIEDAAKDYEVRRAELEEARARMTDARIEAEKREAKVGNIRSILSRVRNEAAEHQAGIEGRNDRLEKIREEREELKARSSESDRMIREAEQEREKREQELSDLRKKKAEQDAEIARCDEEIHHAESAASKYREDRHLIELRTAKNETQLENLKNKLWDEFELSYAQALDMRRDDFVLSTSVRQSRELRKRIRELGDVSISSIDEYEQVNRRYHFLTEQRNDVVQAMDELNEIIRDMDRTIIRKFRESFDQVSECFENVFHELFGGGHAELRLEDADHPLESGVEIVAQPPGKKLQNINLLSGGEKTMTAIALMFSVLKVKPTPFCILDEVEAALDDRNIIRFSDYLRNFDGIQFTLITHQQETMEHADVLFGITMPERGVSQCVSLRLGEFDPSEYTN
jgi:chromosome segregation protein